MGTVWYEYIMFIKTGIVAEMFFLQIIYGLFVLRSMFKERFGLLSNLGTFAYLWYSLVYIGTIVTLGTI